MNTLIKALIVGTPILAIVLYYVMAQQAEIKADMHIQETAIERDWAEAMEGFSETAAERSKYAGRAERAKKRIEAHEQQQAEKAQRVEDFERAFDFELKEMETKK